jgi:NAD(P)-dependent dehydrogenase (short-subunit alcohol dehydrogenase family)
MTVAVVTGAARGIGRGIALVLGEAGATVHVTDRETRRRQPLDHWHNMVDVGVRSHLVAAHLAAPLLLALEAFPPGTDSVERPGRAVRALPEDPGVARHAGRTLTVAELDAEYGFGDVEVPAARA